MAREDIVVINEGLESRTRTSSSGAKTRFTFSIAAEPIVHNFAEMDLGAPVSLAIKNAIAAGIKAISQQASAGTMRFRREAVKSLAKGAKWATQRYSGGNTGTTQPNSSSSLFNDSGRLANGLTLRQSKTEKAWVVYSPSNRMTGAGFADPSKFVAMVDRLRDLVPAIRNPFSDTNVAAALGAVMGDVFMRKLAQTTKTADELGSEILDAVSDIASQFNDSMEDAG